MEKKIKKLFATILQISPSQISDITTAEHFDCWSSFKHLVLVSGFEEEFDIEIEPEEIFEMYKNFRAFKNVIMQKLQRDEI